jgi:homoserine kinase type II
VHRQLNAEIAARLAEAFDLGTVGSISYLATGLMNRNWRLTTDRGTYALKQIIDVPVPTAQRNLRVLTALHQAGIPTCPPVLSRSGEAVILIDGLGYCTLPWRDGTHPQGPDLTLTQARHLGVVVGRIHDALGRVGPDLGLPPATARPTVQVTAPDDAIAEAHRYQAAASLLAAPSTTPLSISSTGASPLSTSRLPTVQPLKQDRRTLRLDPRRPAIPQHHLA